MLSSRNSLGEVGEKMLAKFLRLYTVEFDDESSAAFERYAHDIATSFLRDLERAITRSRLHRGHCLPFPCVAPIIVRRDALPEGGAGISMRLEPSPP
jgi:hypothetical protein